MVTPFRSAAIACGVYGVVDASVLPVVVPLPQPAYAPFVVDVAPQLRSSAKTVNRIFRKALAFFWFW